MGRPYIRRHESRVVYIMTESSHEATDKTEKKAAKAIVPMKTANEAGLGAEFEAEFELFKKFRQAEENEAAKAATESDTEEKAIKKGARKTRL